jgi:hypothetical protein
MGWHSGRSNINTDFSGSGRTSVGQSLLVQDDINVTGSLTVGDNITVVGNILPSAVGTPNIGSTSAEFGNVYLADAKNVFFGSDQDCTLGFNTNYGAPVLDAKASAFWVISSGATTEKPELFVACGANDTSAAHITLVKSRGWDGSAERVVADDDYIGNFNFAGADGDGTSTTYGKITVQSSDISPNAACGTMTFQVQNSASSQSIMTLGGRDVANKNYSSVTLASDTTLIGTRPSVTNLGANGSVPITGLTANVDANGSARTGIRFAGAGVAGQMLIVQNTGGENLTFHATEGTALLSGVATANDTMLPGGTYVFVSDGSLWVLIGGGAATNALGLAAG